MIRATTGRVEPDLNDEFVRDAGPGEVALVKEALAQGGDGVRVFEFNVYEVTVNYLASQLTVADVLAADRECQVTFDEFIARL